MKKTIIFLLLSLCYFSSFSQKMILNPKFDATNSPNVQITKITLSDTATVLDFKVAFTPKQWIIFAKDNYIESSVGNNKLYSKAAIGYLGNLGDKWFMPDSGIVHFSLIYPKIDAKTTKIDFIESEKSEGAFKILGIHINYKSPMSENIKGNWLRTDGSNEWTLGIYDKVAIYKNDIWQYKSVTKLGKTTKIVIKNDNKTISLTLLPAGNNKIMITEGKQPMRTYSRTKTYNATYKAKGEPAFSNLPFGYKQTIIRGFLDGYSPKLGFKSQILYLNNSLTLEDIPTMIYINPDGTFESRFDLPYPQVIRAYFGNGSSFEMYLEPGDKPIVYLSLDKRGDTTVERTSIERSTCFMGGHAMESSNLLAMNYFAFVNYKKNRGEENLTPKEFKSNRLLEWQADKDSLKSISGRLSITPKALQLKNLSIDLTRSCAILDYIMYRKSAAYKDSTKRINVEDSYYDFLKSDFKNATLLPQCSDFSTFINRLEYSDFYFTNIPDQRNLYKKEYVSRYKIFLHIPNYENWFPILESLGEKITPEEKEMARWYKGSYDSIMADTLNVKKFMPIVSKFTKKNSSNISYFDFINKLEYQRSLSRNLFETDSHFIQEVTTLRSMNNRIRKESLTESQLNNLLTYFDTPFLKTELTRINNSKIALANEKTVKPKDPVTKADKIFQNIISKYKGNIVLVDFWATSCGPCRAEMTEHKNLPDELKDKKIKLVYITDEEASPLQSYTDFTKDIKGEHYRITREAWNQLAVQYKINGIPRYMMLNKYGAIIEDQARYWGDNLKKRLLELEKD